MTRDRFPLYGLALVAGGALALWAGLPPFLVLLLVVCPLMMIFVMRGMHGGEGHGGKVDPRTVQYGSNASQPRRPDGSHERIDNP